MFKKKFNVGYKQQLIAMLVDIILELLTRLAYKIYAALLQKKNTSQQGLGLNTQQPETINPPNEVHVQEKPDGG